MSSPDEQLSPHFNTREFRCNHCGQLHKKGVSYPLIVMLEYLREHFGDLPATINSGYRCPTHNAACGGSSDSRHMYGDAVDLVISGVKPSEVHAAIDSWHKGGLGKYSTFTHIDMRGTRARWSG